MDAGQPRDSELERELDGLYRKVAGLDPPGDKLNRTVLETNGKTPAAANIQKTSRARSVQKKRRRFRISGFDWVLAFILLSLGAIFILSMPGMYHHGTIHFRGTAYPLKTHRLTGEARYYNGKEWLRPPADTGVIALPAEAPKNQAAAPLPVEPPPVEEKGKTLAELPVADTPAKDRRGGYAIQIRAYPEDQKQNALTFLEDMRKKAPDVSMETVSIPGRGVWHRILLGNFSTAEEAAEYQKNDEAVREHPYSFIQKRQGSGPVSVPAIGKPPT